MGVASLTLLAISCSTVHRSVLEPSSTADMPASELTYAYLWCKYAAESRALCYQAYNVARDRLAAAIAQNASIQDRLAVILDIDETVLDNTPYERRLACGDEYSLKTWMEWTAKAEAQALAGARDFLCYAVSNGVEVFYISNRKTNELDGTIRNLSKRNFPMADPDHVLLQKASEGKVTNRNKVSENRTIVLLIGDNLNDLSEIFANVSVRERFSLTDSNREEFGRKFIVVPNPMYGGWENTLYDNKRLSTSEKAAIRRSLLKLE